MLSGIGSLSDVAVLKRLRNSKNWIGKLIAIIMQKRLSELKQLPGIRLRVVDATTINVPGSKGIDWRVHLSFDLGNLCLDGIEITDRYGGENLACFEAQDNEIFVADGAYPFILGMAPALNAGAGLIVSTLSVKFLHKKQEYLNTKDTKDTKDTKEEILRFSFVPLCDLRV